MNYMAEASFAQTKSSLESPKDGGVSQLQFIISRPPGRHLVTAFRFEGKYVDPQLENSFFTSNRRCNVEASRVTASR